MRRCNVGLLQRMKQFFERGRYRVTTSYLDSILNHPRVSVSKSEYNRILDNLRYYEGRFDNVSYRNSDGTVQERTYNHLPLARTVSKKLANLVFNEQAEITVEDDEAKEFIQRTLLNDRFNKNFERYLESALALGGLAMRPYIDGDVIRIGFIQAPVFFPLQSNTQDVSSAAILTKTVKERGNRAQYYSLIEFHEWDGDVYTIDHELYLSEDSGKLGNRVGLSELYEDLEENIRITNLSRPLFTYLKTPGMNNKDIDSPLGLSIFDNAKTTMDFINRTFDEFSWEVRMGQRRVAVPEQTTKMMYDEFGNQVTVRKHFDPDQNVFVQLDAGGDMDRTIGIVDLTTPIRSESYIQAINKGLALFEMQVGVAAGMFSFDGKSMKTATEVVSENSDTYQLRNSIVALVEQSLKELIVSICELAKGAGLYSGPIPELKDISVNLDDGVFTDRQSELKYWAQMVASGFVSRKYGLTKILGITDEEAEEIISDINDESMFEVNVNRSPLDRDLYGQ